MCRRRFGDFVNGSDFARMDLSCGAHPLEWNPMKLVDYLTTRVPGDLDTSDQFRLAISTFVVTAASVVVVHQFLPGGRELRAVITHSLVLAMTYTACVLVVSGLLFLLVQRAKLDKVEVWHLWAMSFLAFNLGYFLDVPVGDSSRFALHPAVSAENSWFHYSRLVPIWVLITYVFIQAHTRRALRAELGELVRINEELTNTAPVSTGGSIDVVSGKKRINLDADRVSHISVEDHYCYIHHRDATGWRRTDVTLPLRDVMECVPASFLLVHRSHVVNPIHLERIEREGRAYRLILTNDVVLPISRHRLNKVLPKVREYLGAE